MNARFEALERKLDKALHLALPQCITPASEEATWLREPACAGCLRWVSQRRWEKIYTTVPRSQATPVPLCLGEAAQALHRARCGPQRRRLSRPSVARSYARGEAHGVE